MATEIKAEKIACEAIAPNKQHQNIAATGKGATKDEAETNLNDKILDIVVAKRDTDKVSCDDGKCDTGSCYTLIALQGQVVFRRVRRKNIKVGLCMYQGNVTSSCICVV
jgi:hypothetical protein